MYSQKREEMAHCRQETSPFPTLMTQKTTSSFVFCLELGERVCGPKGPKISYACCRRIRTRQIRPQLSTYLWVEGDRWS